MAEAEIASDWRERLETILASDGVSQPPEEAPWRAGLKIYIRALLLLGLYGAAFIGVVLFAVVWSKLGLPEELAGLVVLLALFVANPILLITAIWPRLQALSRQLRMAWRTGVSPIGAVHRAKAPPVLFLRSFKFDQQSSKPSFWTQLLMTMAAGGAGAPTPEMSLALAMPRGAPLLAIGQPGEPEGPPGALRFHVRDDLWRDVVEAMTPLCQAVIWTTGHGRNLRWEIQHLIATSTPGRLILWLHVGVGAWTPRARAEEWARFREAYQDVFPKSLPADLGKARFVAFESDWTPIMVPGPRSPVSLGERVRFMSGPVLGLRSHLQAQARANPSLAAH